MRLGFVVPRYGRGVLGGAETLCRDFAERLAAAGHTIEVHTTCALDHFSWTNALEPGVTTERGVRVHRHPVTVARDHVAMARLEAEVASGRLLAEERQLSWLRNTGLSEPLLEAIDTAAARLDAVVFMPYLFASSAMGAVRRPERSLVVPCLHDEPYARFSVLQRMLAGVRGLIFNTEAECRLAHDLLGDLPPHRVVGIGVDPPGPTDGAGLRRRLGLDGDIVVYAGRREGGKNWPLLVEWVTLYNSALTDRPPVTLVTMGSGRADVPRVAQRFVRDLGFASEGDKHAAMSEAVAVVQLSRNESFSYVLMEGWLCGAPAIVHADCAVTTDHCAQGGGGIWVRSAEQFAEGLERLRGDARVRRTLADQGRAYVEDRYGWPAVIGRLEAALAALAPA